MHIETQVNSSVCPMTVKKSCESLGRQRINSRAIFANSEGFNSIHNKISFFKKLSAFTKFFKCLVREQITPQLL